MDVGLDRLSRLPSLVQRLRDQRVGLLTHAAAVDRRLHHVLDVLGSVAVVPKVIFAPEHGLGSVTQDMAPVAEERERRTGARVVSLYGDEAAQLVPRPDDLSGIDVLVVDLVDVGARYYTFVWTALLAARAANDAAVHVVVLDRPNPIGGLAAWVEGRTQEQGYLSFVGLEPVPIRHGMTIAELIALHVRAAGRELGPNEALSVVELVGWDRAQYATDWDRPFVSPSPNMPTADTALVYPGGCLIEGTNLSEGRGLTRPFEMVGAPWLDGRKLASELNGLGLGGFVARAIEFSPTFHKHAGQRCGGVQVHPTDPRSFRPVATYVALVALARSQQPERFRFRTERYEFVDDIPAFDLLTGSANARRALLAGKDARTVAEQVSSADPAWPDAMGEARALVEQAGWTS